MLIRPCREARSATGAGLAAATRIKISHDNVIDCGLIAYNPHSINPEFKSGWFQLS